MTMPPSKGHNLSYRCPIDVLSAQKSTKRKAQQSTRPVLKVSNGSPKKVNQGQATKGALQRCNVALEEGNQARLGASRQGGVALKNSSVALPFAHFFVPLNLGQEKQSWPREAKECSAQRVSETIVIKLGPDRPVQPENR
ncbi:uncharacterized protein DS421_18g624290 [Arachis hypogaea]|nr:uncharacterized protein DS421_18g624290 [Arachis hypogaea]